MDTNGMPAPVLARVENVLLVRLALKLKDHWLQLSRVGTLDGELGGLDSMLEAKLVRDC